MGLQQELEVIRDALGGVLDDCNGVAEANGLTTADTVSALPRLVDDAYTVAYNTAFSAGEAAGLAEGEAMGRSMACDEFWDEFQENGNRTDYQMAFASKYWNDDTFKPKYDLAPTGMFQAFYGCHAASLPVVLDTSNCGQFSYAFCSSKFTSLPVIDCRKQPAANKIASLFYAMSNVVSIEKVYLHGGDVTDSFTRMSALEEIRLEGELVTSVDLAYSAKLSKASIESFAEVLSPSVTGKTLTLSPTAVNNAFTTEEWETLVATKPNWTIVK